MAKTKVETALKALSGPSFSKEELVVARQRLEELEGLSAALRREIEILRKVIEHIDKSLDPPARAADTAEEDDGEG